PVLTPSTPHAFDARRHPFSPESWRATGAATPRSLVGGKFVSPELRADGSNLVAPLLAQWICGEQVLVVPVIEHLQYFDGRFLEQPDSSKIVVVRALERRRRLQRVEPRLGSPTGCQRRVHPALELRRPHLIDLVKDLPEAQANRAPFDFTMDWP